MCVAISEDNDDTQKGEHSIAASPGVKPNDQGKNKSLLLNW